MYIRMYPGRGVPSMTIPHCQYDAEGGSATQTRYEGTTDDSRIIVGDQTVAQRKTSRWWTWVTVAVRCTSGALCGVCCVAPDDRSVCRVTCREAGAKVLPIRGSFIPFHPCASSLCAGQGRGESWLGENPRRNPIFHDSERVGKCGSIPVLHGM
jgi:hypothetical protein